MNHLFAYFQEREHTFAAYLASLINFHKKTGNLPHIPDAPMTNDDVARATLPTVAPVQHTGAADATALPETVVFDPGKVDPKFDHIIPDENCLVFLTGIPDAWGNWRHNIAEVVNSDLANVDQKGHGFANLTQANGVYNVGFMHFIGTCYESTAAGPGLPYTLDTSRPIHETQSWPNAVHEFDGGSYNLGTVAGVKAWCIKLGHPPGPNAK